MNKRVRPSTQGAEQSARWLLALGLAVSVIAAELEAEHGVTFDRANATIRTVELCGDVMHDGIHCSKVRGHDGVHELVGRDGRSQLRWK